MMVGIIANRSECNDNAFAGNLSSEVEVKKAPASNYQRLYALFGDRI